MNSSPWKLFFDYERRSNRQQTLAPMHTTAALYSQKTVFLAMRIDDSAEATSIACVAHR